MSIQVKGIQNVLKNLSKKASDINKATDRGVVATASEIQREAILSISSRPSMGESYKRGSKTHVASKPGDAPNTDTGTLVKSIAISHIKGSKIAYVFTDLDYGAYLELVMDRPWLYPAMIAKQDELQPNIRAELAKI